MLPLFGVTYQPSRMETRRIGTYLNSSRREEKDLNIGNPSKELGIVFRLTRIMPWESKIDAGFEKGVEEIGGPIINPQSIVRLVEVGKVWCVECQTTASGVRDSIIKENSDSLDGIVTEIIRSHPPWMINVLMMYV
ncbi:unnamed protein product [Arabis nemorensis]|uniref:Uncharacterized protein n=1 Tax=Arabis nemorensis TaxID=586526 RepID=A0A565B126_9BRAS|nr:unnamed protein product [Arabis nemorensis]